MDYKEYEKVKKSIEYNSQDLGEFGKVIKLEYLFNILEKVVK